MSNSRQNIIQKIETVTNIDNEGNEKTTIKETSTSFQRNLEPDYIKLYTKMWCEFNQIPTQYRELFLQLVSRMSYCNADDLENSQLVNTGKPWSTQIMDVLGWQTRMYQKGLKALCDCKAIKQINRGVYQINPNYAGKGEWKYNARSAHGGVEDLIATFNFKDGSVKADIVWADDGQANELNDFYRDTLDVKKKEQAVLKTVNKKVV